MNPSHQFLPSSSYYPLLVLWCWCSRHTSPVLVRSRVLFLSQSTVGLWLYPGTTETWTIARAWQVWIYTAYNLLALLASVWRIVGIQTEHEIRTIKNLNPYHGDTSCCALGALHRSSWFILVPTWMNVFCGWSCET